MDQRLGELQERLWKKKAALQQKENLPVSLNNTFITISIYHREISNKAKKVHDFLLYFCTFLNSAIICQAALNSVNPQHEPSSRVAAVGPYIQSASRSSSQLSAGLPCQETMVKSAYPDGTATLPMPASSRKPPAIRAKPSISMHSDLFLFGLTLLDNLKMIIDSER